MLFDRPATIPVLVSSHTIPPDTWTERTRKGAVDRCFIYVCIHTHTHTHTHTCCNSSLTSMEEDELPNPSRMTCVLNNTLLAVHG